MKKHILTAAIFASLTLLAACSGSSKQGTTDSSAVSQDTAATNGGTGSATGVDSGTTPTGTPSQGGEAGGDTSANKQNPVSSPGGTPQ
jgi:ABC-type glycerol-3-phosphate transport system substrate-binding protein